MITHPDSGGEISKTPGIGNVGVPRGYGHLWEDCVLGDSAICSGAVGLFSMQFLIFFEDDPGTGNKEIGISIRYVWGSSISTKMTSLLSIHFEFFFVNKFSNHRDIDYS